MGEPLEWLEFEHPDGKRMAKWKRMVARAPNGRMIRSSIEDEPRKGNCVMPEDDLPVPEFAFDGVVERPAEKLRACGCNFGTEDAPVSREFAVDVIYSCVENDTLSMEEAACLLRLSPDLLAIVVEATELPR
jgi:hypothetical protein